MSELTACRQQAVIPRHAQPYAPAASAPTRPAPNARPARSGRRAHSPPAVPWLALGVGDIHGMIDQSAVSSLTLHCRAHHSTHLSNNPNSPPSPPNLHSQRPFAPTCRLRSASPPGPDPLSANNTRALARRPTSARFTSPSSERDSPDSLNQSILVTTAPRLAYCEMGIWSRDYVCCAVPLCRLDPHPATRADRGPPLG